MLFIYPVIHFYRTYKLILRTLSLAASLGLTNSRTFGKFVMSIFTIFGTLHTHNALCVPITQGKHGKQAYMNVCRCCNTISWCVSQFRLMNSWCWHVSVWCRAIFHRLTGYISETFRKCSLLFAACGLHVLLQFATWQTKFVLRIVISILQITFSQFTELCNASQIAVNPSHLFCIYMFAHISVAL